jgi:predicted DNA-binding transcriptional regulator YafY
VRADRLVALLLLLQARGTLTAAQAARELEVSERTARRDLEALGMAGIPVYAVRGRGGGWRLAGRGRTDLTGLTAAEARSLFLLAGPGSGVTATPELRAALRKLVGALPAPLREAAEASSSSVVIDPATWERPAPVRPPPGRLDAVQAAVVERAELRLGYVARDGVATERVVQPLGMAAKGATWYLLADTAAGLRTFRVDRVASVARTGRPAVRPDDFDLAETWRLVADRVDRLRTPVVAHALVEPSTVPVLRMVLGTRVAVVAGDGGRLHAELRGHDVRSLAGEIAGFGAAVVVVDPPELRDELARVGAELVATYQAAGG